MTNSNLQSFIQQILSHLPSDWLDLTTHRLDIYNEELAKTEFMDRFEGLYQEGNVSQETLNSLPTAYDYIRLGHPLSSVLEWTIAKQTGVKAENIIAFSSKTAPLLAVLRKNLFSKTKTRIYYFEQPSIDFDTLKTVYGYSFEHQKIDDHNQITEFEGSTVFIEQIEQPSFNKSSADFEINLLGSYGSIIKVNEAKSEYISEIQHVRRRETIAMTPADCYAVLEAFSSDNDPAKKTIGEKSKNYVEQIIQDITGTKTKPLIGSSGLSIQYAIMMGLLDFALEQYPDKPIKIIVPPNCYGGTNDQARRVAACLPNVEVMDLPVDGDSDMVNSVEQVLSVVAAIDAVPLIIAEIPTNPRVEVPDLTLLKNALEKSRTTSKGTDAVHPVFILDQTFCPNVQFLGDEEIFSSIDAISYVSGSKFPSGGRCTAGYCVANTKASKYVGQIEKHLKICDNEATDLQIKILEEQMPSMLTRIDQAYHNTREFVSFIQEVLPEAKINFVSEELAKEGFTPSVFSLDLPTKGDSFSEREAYKRNLNDKLITMMITEIPAESKYCVSYGQLKGCYWTIPATSTQGTTKEADKDYIARVALSPKMDLDKHKQVFKEFVDSI